MRCIHTKSYDQLYKLFGFDNNKIVKEVEKYLGKKLLKPEQPQP